MIAGSIHARQLTLIGFGLVLCAAWLCYVPAVHGEFRLDDRSNLGGLMQVDNLDSAIDFMLAGEAGPTGRPLALATFALQAGDWSEGPAAFLRVNILIHLLNAVVLLYCLYRIARARGTAPDRALQVAVAAASVWVLLPLLASATLLVVQRMTTLSALFMLLGLAGYLAARTRLEERPVLALALMTASLVTGTILASLCKESGLLLPVFALVLEATVLERPQRVSPRLFGTWQAGLLGFPLFVLLYHLGAQLSYSETIELRRGFNAPERLLTEARILWLYVQKALVGLPGSLGIYQTPPAVSRSLFEPWTLLAVLSWLALLGASLMLRRAMPLFAFAVLWFLAGHLIESTVVPLELYFEHRNYVAIAGPLFALVAALARVSPRVPMAGAAVLVAVLVVNGFLLYTFASMWGEPSRTSRYWALRYPDSVRAVTTMAQYQLREQGAIEALRTLDEFVLANPGHAYLRIQELNLRCRVAPGEDHAVVVSQLRNELPTAEFTFSSGTMLSQLLDTVAGSGCNGIGPRTVAELGEVLRSNPRYVKDGAYGQFHFKLLAAIARVEGDHEASLEYLRQAMAMRPSSELNMMMVTALGAAGDFDAALEFIDDARRRPPGNVTRALAWQRDLDGLEAYILSLRDGQGP